MLALQETRVRRPKKTKVFGCILLGKALLYHRAQHCRISDWSQTQDILGNLKGSQCNGFVVNKDLLMLNKEAGKAKGR